MMEELGLDYKAVAMDVRSGTEHKSEWFLKINPNGRVPALGKAAVCAAIAGFVGVSWASNLSPQES